jgi:hypothetical protein
MHRDRAHMEEIPTFPLQPDCLVGYGGVFGELLSKLQAYR